MEPDVATVVGLCVFLLLWYGGGHLYNRRRGRRLFRWLEEGLDVLGGERESGWIGSPASGARINITHAKAPFRRLEIALLLANRELPFLWFIDHLRSRRDRVIIRATLRSPRRGVLEVSSARHRAIGPRRDGPVRRREPSWTWQPAPHGLVVAYEGPGAQRQVAALHPWLDIYGAHLYRLSWRKTDLQLQINVNERRTGPSDKLLAGLQAMVQSVNRIHE